MKTLFSLLAVAVLVVVGPSLNAAEKKATVERSTDLINQTVKNKAGDHIGYVEDLAVELPSGRIGYVALSTKNALGIGGRLYALPYSAFVWSDDRKHLVLDVPKDEFTKAEGFDAKAWPNNVDDRWARLGKKTAAVRAGDAKLTRMSSLTSLTVKNEAGTNLGKTVGFGIDYDKQRVVYAAMSHGGVIGIGSKYFAIPWEALNLKSLNLRVDDRCFVLNASPQDFDNSTGFDPNAWPDKGNDRFMKNTKKTDK